LVTSSLIRKTSYSTRQQLFNWNQKAWIIKRSYSNEALHPSLDDSSWVDYWIRNIELPDEGEKPGVGSRLLWSPQFKSRICNRTRVVVAISKWNSISMFLVKH